MNGRFKILTLSSLALLATFGSYIAYVIYRRDKVNKSVVTKDYAHYLLDKNL